MSPQSHWEALISCLPYFGLTWELDDTYCLTEEKALIFPGLGTVPDPRVTEGKKKSVSWTNQQYLHKLQLGEFCNNLWWFCTLKSGLCGLARLPPYGLSTFPASFSPLKRWTTCGSLKVLYSFLWTFVHNSFGARHNFCLITVNVSVCWLRVSHRVFFGQLQTD